MSKTYTIIGTGAIGGLIGGLLAKNNHTVRFLLHSDYETVKQQGLTIEFDHQTTHLTNIFAYSDISQIPPSDVVILALKVTDNPAVAPYLSRLLNPQGYLLVLQNGINVDREMAECVGSDRVVGGSMMVNVTKIGPGHIRHNLLNFIELAEYQNDYQPTPPSQRVKDLAETLKHCGFQVSLSDDLMLTRFRKLCNNVPVNGLNTLFIHSGLEWVVFDETRQLIQDLIEEVMHIAKAWDRNISERMPHDQLELLDKAYTQAQTHKTPVKTSMAEDFLQKKPLELKAFYKNLLQIAEEKGVLAPKISFLYQVLSFLDVENQK